ncbi:MAG: hypothetical protein NTV24_04015 [Candidatus Woesebacteria bacterium]|nr:hypothetical protein [Candidatus Woesebacteria bacterium]
MKYLDLRKFIEGNVFGILDVAKLFPEEKPEAIRTQLYRLVKNERLFPIKRGLYAFDKNKVDDLELAGKLYSPSYISLETALNYYGVIPDIPMAVRSVTPITTKKIETDLGDYYYLKIDSKLFFGFSQAPYAIAHKEKALLDYLYLRKVRKVSAEARLNLKGFDWKRYHEYAVFFPKWVQQLKLS